MKNLSLLFIVFLFAFNLPRLYCQGLVEDRTFYSPLLETTKHFYVYLPADYYQSTDEYPVVYFFRNREQEWFEWSALNEVADQLIASGLIGDMILVGPNHGSDKGVSQYYSAGVNMLRPDLAPVTGIGTGMFEDYIINDLIAHVDSTLRTITDKEHRGIDGFSIGGYTSITISMRYPEVFSSIGSFDGSIMYENLDDPSIPGVGPDDDLWVNEAIMDPIFDNPRDFSYMLLHSPLDILENADTTLLNQIRSNRYHISHSYKEGVGNCLRNSLLVYKMRQNDIRNSWGNPIIYYNASHSYDVAKMHANASLIKHWQTFNGTKISTPTLVDFSITESSGVNHKVVVFNYGPGSLTVNDIYIGSGGFSITNLPSLPLTLQPDTDTLAFDINFSPFSDQNFTDTLFILSDDPMTPIAKTILKGKGGSYKAEPGFLYATSYSNLYYTSLDNIDAQIVGSYGSEISNITELIIDPYTNELFGLSKSTGNYYDVIRLNSKGGDAFLYHFFICPSNIKAASFGPDSLLYLGCSDGKIYTVDVYHSWYSMPVNLITELGLPFTGFAFDYATGDLWSAVAETGNLDKIYKIDLYTGNAIFIGNTGIGKTIDDLCFDAFGNLYGLVGSGSSIDSLIKINTTTGIATNISSLNTTNLYSIAISQEQPNGIITTPISSLPNQFFLMQNFPNPFNPQTKIKYSIPKYTSVTLKVFDILGNEIKTLVNEEQSAGEYQAIFDGSELPSGVYIYRIQTNEFTAGKKMILMK